MQPGSNEELRKAYRIAAVIGAAMIASLVMYAVVVELIKKQNAPFSGFSPMPDGFEILRYALLAVVAVEFIVIRFLNTLILSGRVPIRSSPTTAPYAPGVQRLITASIISYALCESVAVYGLVLFFIQGNSNDFYLFLALSLLCFIVYFPRYNTWEEWLEEQEREQARRPQS